MHTSVSSHFRHNRYNLFTLKLRWVTVILPIILAAAVRGQSAIPAGQTVLVVPFENRSRAPGLEWVGDSFPELLKQRLDSPTLYLLPREDRIRAYDRLGIPGELRPSRPTIYRIAEQLDVDYVVLGDYQFDGRTFTTTAQLLDMRHEQLLPEMQRSGPLPQLIELQTNLAWDILHSLFPTEATSRETFLAQAPPVGLDAFEYYIKGVIASTGEERIRHLREAVRLGPSYGPALLCLGETYYQQRQYDQAEAWLSKLPQTDPAALEAEFYLGLAAFDRSEFTRSESAFNFVAERLPLSEMYNNIAVAIEHRDGTAAAEFLQKAIAEDPGDPDYHFNLAIELYGAGDLTGASRQLREVVSLNPHDAEAKSFLENIAGGSARGVVRASIKVPQPRMRTTYDEGSFRQLALKISAVAEQRLAKTDPRTHAQFHADRGHQLLKQGFVSEAEREFGEAIALSPTNSDAHAGLATILERANHVDQARSEAQEALRMQPSAEALLVLARLNLRENRTGAAAEEVDRALRLEPSNPVAQALRRSVAAKLAQEAQPLPQQ